MMSEVPQEVINRDRFISEFDAKPWDPKRREKCFIYEKEITDVQDITSDLSEGFDLERDDGLLATILVYIGSIYPTAGRITDKCRAQNR
ncbi:hypothetical protein GCK72_011099 [Caenorhabditis remanei]|uniref:Uncharacterized protein n=1 Tax=Caenorhabditis remanei TaxID=31234 RepID=A0A6A5H6U7_CAERE|nr:hypothetical protein GCK72_011088 [Caenorhabditis remanei]XP_053587787.1 hypothetical protein GCK72_011092 [Caenorhabditis remanei]XP_053587794.1 hypothetical protein GCK72_011099 [Caenorhabditis remanei]KAF1762825.1 hypothetical protein GCK72_011088 [Caenorhabditis remanei]KAF1762829.1 hypothetical protein GCK72_011092 [Caenorhabditis remanei]KAF1762836.1 hypothetical protein GCK72_011099 [Caenorhabditis remanei]